MAESKSTFVDHLSELRKRIIYSLIAFGLSSALTWQYVPALLNFTAPSAGKLVFLHPAEAFTTYLKVCLWSGFFFSLPATLYHLWKFIGTGLTDKEKKHIIIFAPASLFLFFSGAAFGYFLAIPAAIKFLVGFGAGWVEPMLSINEYISFVGWLLLAFGASFELPLVVFFLAMLKIVNTDSLRNFRKQAILLIFIAAAMVTPTPDAFTQLLLAIPLIGLFELGVFLSRFA